MEKIKLKNLSRTELRLLTAWLLIIAFLLFETALRKGSLTFDRLNEETLLTAQKYEKFTRVIMNKDDINALYARSFSGRVNVYDSQDINPAIEALAKRSGISIINVSTVTTKDQGFYNLYSLEITTQNTVPEMMAFLNELNEQLKGIELENLQVRAKDKGRLPEITIKLNTIGFKDL